MSQRYQYLGLLDFEANCVEGKVMENQEIIEFPIVVYDLNTGRVVPKMQFHHYCQTNTPITEYCTSLTGITQKMVDEGKPFKVVLDLFYKWMEHWNLYDKRGYSKILFCTCGDWDLKTMLPKQCANSELEVPYELQRWCNVKSLFKYEYEERRCGLKAMVEYFGLKMEGRHHSGIDDCRNLARVVHAMFVDGVSMEVNGGRGWRNREKVHLLMKKKPVPKVFTYDDSEFPTLSH